MYLSSSTQSISMDLITSFIDIWFLAYREANTCLFSSHIESILCRECVQPSAIHQREWALFIPYSFPTIQYYEDTDWYHAFNTYLTSQSCPRWHRKLSLLHPLCCLSPLPSILSRQIINKTNKVQLGKTRMINITLLMIYKISKRTQSLQKVIIFPFAEYPKQASATGISSDAFVLPGEGICLWPLLQYEQV